MLYSKLHQLKERWTRNVALLLMVYCVLYIRSCTLSIMVRENLHAIFCAMMGHHQYLLRLEVVSSELLNNEIETQKILLSRGNSLVK